MKASIQRQVTTVTTSVVTTKVTTKDVEVNHYTFDSENESHSDTRDESLHSWEKNRREDAEPLEADEDYEGDDE